MRLTLAQLEACYWIARLGGFHAAARHLNLTQPTVSGRIRDLEADLGGAVFDRSGAKVRLTPLGLSILPQVEQVLGLATEIGRAGKADRLRGLLRLGVVETVAQIALPSLLEALERRRPGLRVELTVDIGASLLRRIEDRELDMIVSNEHVGSDGIATHVLGEMDIAWIGPADHALAGRELTPADLAEVAIFTQPSRSTLERTLRGWFDAAGIQPRAVSTCNSLSTICELVAAGLGFAVVTPAVLRPDMAARVMRFEANPPIPPRALSVAALRQTWSDDTAFVGGFVAEALTRAGALIVSSGARA